jgi:hypothetical protein
MNIWARKSAFLMRYEFLLSDMRRVLLLVLLLLMPAVWAEETESWTVEVEDPLGNPISDCQIVLNEPWTGSVIDSPSGGMYQASATCDGYVVMWHPPVPSTQTTVVLQAHPIIEDLFTVEGAHTMQVLGSAWEESISDGLVDAPNGVPIVLIGEGGSAVRYGESSITIPNATTTYDLQGNYSEDVIVKAIQTGSGSMVEWDNQNLTVGEFGGGWSARVYMQGMPIGLSVWPPSSQWIFEQLNSTSISGIASLEFTSNLTPNEDITGIWNASHVFNNGLGLPFIPGVAAGIESQVDRFLGGDVSQLETLIESLVYVNGKEALCCIIDDSPVLFSEQQMESEIDFSTGHWGWQESAIVDADRSHISLMRLEVPFFNDLRQTTPLNLVTNGELQYLSSPLAEWINGTPENFTLTRDETSVAGFYTISFGPNSAPILSMAEDYALPWDNVSYNFDVIIDDAPLSIHDCTWNISGLTGNIGVNLTAFEQDTNLPVSVVCTDEGGLAGTFSTTFILDGGNPWINASNDVQEILPGPFNWDLMVGDDHDDNLRVYWTSNKSEDWWYTGDLLQTSFSADSNLNSINDNISERHKARNQIEYWLSAEVSDDVGHSTTGNWTVRLLDNSGPVVIATIESLEDDGEWKTVTSVSRPGDVLRLNLTQTFDDHSSIDKINFSISNMDSEYSDLSWSEIQYWALPELGVGYHQINIAGMDEAGNLAGNTIGVAIAPPIARNLEIIDIKASSTDVEPGVNQFWVTVQNNGASSTEFILCSDEVCVDSIVGPSSYSQTATAIVPMKVDLDWFETFSVELSYLDDANQTVVKYSTSEYSSGIGFGALELVIFVGLGILAVIWARSRNEPRF